MCTNDNLKQQFNVYVLQKGTRELYQYYVAKLSEDPQAASVYGIKCVSE